MNRLVLTFKYTSHCENVYCVAISNAPFIFVAQIYFVYMNIHCLDNSIHNDEISMY